MNLESYIRKNRSNLDVERPDEEYLWTGISQAIDSKKSKKHFGLLRYAAAASILFFISVTVAYFIGKGNGQQMVFANIDPKLANQEAEFKIQIDSYSKLIQQASINQDQLATNNSEIQYIDDLISYYSKDLKQNGPNPKLINSLMDLYRKKIMLLERMLNEIQKSKDHEKRKINI